MPLPPVLALLLLALAGSAQAQYQCRGSDGQTRFQQTPCAAGETETTLKRAPPSAAAPSAEQRRARMDALDRRVAIRLAIEAGRPAVGMSQAELDLALGPANSLTQSQSGAQVREKRLYRRHGRAYTVISQAGVVTAVQERQDRAPRPPCPNARELRDLEIELSKFANRDKPRLRAELQRRLDAGRACRS